MGQWWAYRSTKAKRELGWKPAHHEDTLERTIAWYRDRGTRGLAPTGTGQPLPLRVAGFAARRVAGIADRLTP
jgi:dihydroflavonol-4-reductase